ncbi:MAG: glycine cleavage system protein H [Acidobacteria bacterium]|nr:glycine cleavage system protein H [Acidobacteriota bacterium]
MSFKRSRFSIRIPLDRVYTRAHYWLRESSPGVWRVGFTKFATRMLGDIVEYQFDANAGDTIAVGDKIGSIEGFKALSEIYAVADGLFQVTNPTLRDDITLIETDPFERGWLYEVQGKPESGYVDANGYAAILDATIEKMLASRHELSQSEDAEESSDNDE